VAHETFSHLSGAMQSPEADGGGSGQASGVNDHVHAGARDGPRELFRDEHLPVLGVERRERLFDRDLRLTRRARRGSRGRIDRTMAELFWKVTKDAQLRELFDKVAELGRAQTEAVTKVEAALVALKDAIEDMHDKAD
jgi:hypothetical protein